MSAEALPSAFVQRMQAQLAGDWPAFLAALAAEVPTSVRYHARKAAALAETELPGAPIPWHPLGRYLPERPASFAHDPLWHAGAYYVQEASSMALLQALPDWARLERPIRVLDLCAAPGGKSTLLADHLPAGSVLIANEVIAQRGAILRENVVRWGQLGVLVTQNDPADFAPFAGAFDMVMVDAPCSGEGLWRKQATAVDEWSEAAVAHCATRQARILAAAQHLVAPGGRLVYSTCTYGPAENAEQLHALVDAGFEPGTLPLADHGFVADGMGYQAYPHRVQGEGFYIAALDKLDGPAFAGEPRVRPKTVPAQWLTAFSGAPVLALYEGRNGAYALPLEQLGFVAALREKLRVTLPGQLLWELKGKTQRPAHGLALAAGASQAFDLPLPHEDVLHYLQGHALPMDGRVVPEESFHGCVRASYGGLGLGWAKPAGNRLNNLLPAGFRLRNAPS